MTIQERIIQFLDYRFIPHTLQGLTVKELCIQIATEQREIDIQKAIEWLRDNMQTNYENVCVAESKEFETHTEFISRFENAMKGE